MPPTREARSPSPTTAGILLGVLVGLGLTAGCSEEPAEADRSPETRAVEETAGDFLAYYEQVLVLSRKYAAEPDSFRAALDSLPGSHLADDQWDAWTAPYRDDPGRLADRLEEIIAGLSKKRPSP